MIRGLQTGELAALTTALLWTMSTLAWTSAGRRIGALAVTSHRLLITCMLLSLHGWLTRGHALPTDADGRTWLLLAISGLLGFFVSDACGFKSLLLIGPRLALLVQSISPPTAAIISWAFLGESLTVWHWLAMAVTLSGVVWVVLERAEATTAVPISQRHYVRGLLLAGISAVAQALGMVLARRGIGEYDAVAATYIRALGAVPAYIILLTISGHWPALARAMSDLRAMTTVAAGSVVGPFLGVALCMVALRHSPAGVVTTLVSTMPVLVLPFTVLIYGERVSLRAVLGALLSVAGIGLMCASG
jgi:drug/metabolite transporter (DMT)-like permease